MMRKGQNTLFGIRFDDYCNEELLDCIVKNKDKKFTYIVTPNVDHIVRINDDLETKKFYDYADISVCDSRILKKLANNLDVNINSVITGSDLTRLMFESYIKEETKITVIGGDDLMIKKLILKYHLKHVNHYNPPMGFIKDEKEIQITIDYILNHPFSYLFLAVGSPQQEKIAYLLKQSSQANGVGLCIGASLLFLTGAEKRAPLWIQKLSLEWLYRLFKNPKRLLKRYLVDDMKIFRLYINEKLKRNHHE